MKMYKLLLSFGLLLMILLSSCSKDDNKALPENNKILGRWVLEVRHIIGQNIPDPYGEGEEFTFNSNNTFTGFYVDLVYNGATIVSRKKIPFSGKYSVSSDGKVLKIMEQGDDPDEYQIYSLTENKLILRGDDSESGQMEAIYNKR